MRTMQHTRHVAATSLAEAKAANRVKETILMMSLLSVTLLKSTTTTTAPTATYIHHQF